MPTLTSRSNSSGVGEHEPRPFAPPTLRALVAQASASDLARSRFLAAANTSLAHIDDLHHHHLDDDDANSDDALSSVSSAPVQSPQERLETEFAAAANFVDSYQGPHRILKQENSTPKKEFYALYQLATVGACPIATPPTSLSKLELARWEKWRALGHMPRHDAMQKFLTTLDNLVDDWRRTAGIANNKPPQHQPSLTDSVISTASSVGAASPSLTYPRPLKKSTSLFDRLPRIFDEFAELQERLEDESRKREELETQLLVFTRDNRSTFTHEIQQLDRMRSSLTTLVKSLEEDVAQHYNELQQSLERHQQLQSAVELSLVLRAERRLQQVYEVVASWLRHKLLRRVLIFVVAVRVWNYLRQKRMPQFLAQLLIRWISSASSLESGVPRTPPLRR